ncbi:MAG: hypothetical protein ACRDPK_00675, partial [Carbonactinosporaceae bacterium]
PPGRRSAAGRAGDEPPAAETGQQTGQQTGPWMSPRMRPADRRAGDDQVGRSPAPTRGRDPRLARTRVRRGCAC